MNENEEEERPLFSVGMIADIQYAPIPDGFSFSGNPRYYRHALVATQRAFETFRNYDSNNNNNNNNNNNSHDHDHDHDHDHETNGSANAAVAGGGVDLVVNLGDIIDGKCQNIEHHGGTPLEPPSLETQTEPTKRNSDDDDDQEATTTEVLPNTDRRHHPGMLSLLEVESAMNPFSSPNDTNNNNNNNVDTSDDADTATATTTTTNNNNNTNNNTNTPPRTKPPQKRTMLHSYGNHCLYNLNRTELREKLGIPFRIEHKDSPPPTGLGTVCDLLNANNSNSNINDNNNMHDGDNTNDAAAAAAAIGDNDGDLVGYYSHVHPPQQQQQQYPTNGNGNGNTSIKFVVLDGYDVCLMRRCPENSRKRTAAVEILQRENGINYRKGNGNENSPEGLEGLQKRFVAFNGAVGPTQLRWLRDELEATRQLNNINNNNNNNSNNRHDQKVIVLSHQPIHPESSNPVCLIWNYDRVLHVLREYSDVVVASFAGHAHRGGYARDEPSGIHFRVVEAVLESEPPTATFGVLGVYRDKLVLEGHGDCESAVYEYE